MSRSAVTVIAVGTNGTGKTTQLKKLLKVNERNLVIPSGREDIAWHGLRELKFHAEMQPDEMYPARKVPVVQIPELQTFTGDRVLHVDGQTAIFNAVAHKTTGFRNGGLLLDDFRNYAFAKGTLTREADGLFINRRHRMLDIFMACHGFEDISRDLLRFEPTLFIFRTTLPPNSASVDKFPNRERFLETVARVNDKARTNPYYFERFDLTA